MFPTFCGFPRPSFLRACHPAPRRRVGLVCAFGANFSLPAAAAYDRQNRQNRKKASLRYTREPKGIVRQTDRALELRGGKNATSGPHSTKPLRSCPSIATCPCRSPDVFLERRLKRPRTACLSAPVNNRRDGRRRDGVTAFAHHGRRRYVSARDHLHVRSKGGREHATLYPDCWRSPPSPSPGRPLPRRETVKSHNASPRAARQRAVERLQHRRDLRQGGRVPPRSSRQRIAGQGRDRNDRGHARRNGSRQ